jgi:hypothetical protein
MRLDRRSLFTAGAASFAFAGLPRFAAAQDLPSDETYRNEVHGYGPLRADPFRVFDLPEGFSYRVVSQAGETMSDGLFVPYKADGMGCFDLGGGQVALIRNHELKPRDTSYGPAGVRSERIGLIDKSLAYDVTGDMPLTGGTTTIIYDMNQRRTVSQHLSLTGTIVNCGGGKTPWGTWLSGEENTDGLAAGLSRNHGFMFEVSPTATGLQQAVPLTAMGRFQHEAATVDPRTGIVYMTEDSFGRTGLFYRYLPEAPGELVKGGRLQALVIKGQPGADTSNIDTRLWNMGDWVEVEWIDLDNVEAPDDDLRMRGHQRGAANFARGEGIEFGRNELYFTCTSGGASQDGQVMRYVPSPREGQSDESGGRLQLFFESVDDKVFDYGDNLTIAPWGDIIICEDRYSETERNHLRGITPEGKVYVIGRNVFEGNAELAGATFSPDGRTLFVNIYWPGITLAITGPWETLRA